jgi:hypothetical protein
MLEDPNVKVKGYSEAPPYPAVTHNKTLFNINLKPFLFSTRAGTARESQAGRIEKYAKLPK